MIIDKILIEDDDIKIAQDICNTIDSQEVRNRSVANVLGCNIAAKFFDEKYDVDINYSLHNVSKILEDIDISDIYVNNNYIDVRLFFNDNELCVPKSHFENNILPAAYMFIKVTPDLTSGEVVGFIKPKDIDTTNEVGNNYVVSIDNIGSIYDIETSLSSNIVIEDVDDIELYSLIDGSIQDKYELYRKLLTSKKARYKLIKIIGANSVFASIKISDLKPNDGSYSELSDTSVNGIDDGFEDLLSETQDNDVNENADILDNAEDIITEEDLELTDNTAYSTETSPSLEEVMNSENGEKDESINSLYEEVQAVEAENNNYSPSTKRKFSFIPLLMSLVFIGAIGYGIYYGYNYYINNNNSVNETEEQLINEPTFDNTDKIKNETDAMPVETVENKPVQEDKNIGNSVAIPAIEQNLNASIIVANLKVDWEVPEGYVTNTAAKRTLVKLGKIIQLNLKSDLMLSNKIPITNKITLEVKYNSNIRKFETVGFIKSSGEKAIDDLILNTVNNIFKLDVNNGTDVFGKLQGNPILIINL